MCIGPDGSGKTAALVQYTDKVFAPGPVSIGADFKAKIETFYGKKIKFLVFDTARGDTRHQKPLRESRSGFLVFFDLADRSSFDDVRACLDALDVHGERPKVLIGSKADLVKERAVSREEAADLAGLRGLPYFEATATDHESTCAPFRHLARAIFEAKEGLTPWHRAVWEEDESQMAREIARLARPSSSKSGSHVDTPDIHGRTPMHHAARLGRMVAASQLLGTGVCSRALGAADRDGCLPLHLAVHNGDFDSAVNLARWGPAGVFGATNSAGLTAMHLAAQDGRAVAIETAFEIGVRELDAVDNKGRTALHVAAKKGHVEAIEALIRLGSRALKVRDKESMTPLRYTLLFAAPSTARVLKAVDDHPTRPSPDVHPESSMRQIELLDEEEAAAIRRRVYFSRSLAWRLLLEIGRPDCAFFLLKAQQSAKAVSTTKQAPAKAKGDDAGCNMC